MNWLALLKSKTAWAGAATAVAALGSYFTGQATLTQALSPLAVGLLGVFLRDGMISHALAASPGPATVPAPPLPAPGASPGPVAAVAAPLGDVMALFQDTVAQTLELAKKQALQELSAALQGLAPVVGTTEAPAPTPPAVQP